MTKVAIFGAGQAGEMISTWLNNKMEVTCFIDNNPKKQGKIMSGYPVKSLEDALKTEPEVIWLAILNKEASVSIKQQLLDTGYSGGIRNILDAKAELDLRLSALRLIARDIIKRNVSGAVAELGVYQGELAAEINRIFADRSIYLFDTFEGFDARDIDKEIAKGSGGMPRRHDFSDTSEALVRAKLPHPEQATIVKGHFPESLHQLEDSDDIRYAFVNLDPDLYEPVLRGLEYFYPRLNRGGVIMIHDYNSMQFPNVKMAVDEYCNEMNLVPIPLMDLHGTAVIVKQ